MASNHSPVDLAFLMQRVADALAIDPFRDGLQFIDARELVEIERTAPFGAGLFTGTVLRSMLIANLGGQDTMDSVARFLAGRVPASHQITVFDDDPDAPPRSATAAALAELAENVIAVHVPAVDTSDAASDPRRIQQIVALLRAPGGCPWDREQTHHSLRDAIIDEAYEVTDAIDSGDLGNLAEELGDLLLLITMHAQIATEAGTFTIEDVQESIVTKIVGRHPHVFGNDTATTAADLGRIWKEAKTRERSARPNKGGGKDLDGEPRSMPALTRATRVLRKQPLRSSPESSTPAQRAERLLRAVAEIVAAGDDPDTVLRAALIRHTSAEVEPGAESQRIVNNPRQTPGE
jgi:tetrapyrrole methylase family protein/MazG family protein